MTKLLTENAMKSARYTTWHLANAPSSEGQVTLTRVDLIRYGNPLTEAQSTERGRMQS